MNSLSRYYLPASEWAEGTLVLKGDEAHHCVRVLRQKVGDAVEVFDGVGGSVMGVIAEAGKSRVLVETQGARAQQSKDTSMHLIQAVPKAGNMELIVQKAVELGVRSIQPLVTENTVVKVDAKKVQKWQRVALEACKQCGQNYLPEVHQVLGFNEWIEKPRVPSFEVVAALDPRSKPLGLVAPGAQGASDISLLVGPEGDFAQSEYDAVIESGFQPASLGNIVLRVETATLYCLSVLKFLGGRAG